MQTRRTASLVSLAVLASPALAQIVLPPFNTTYTTVDLGLPPGVPPSLGGLMLKPGDPDRLLIGGLSNGPNGAVYEIQLERTCGRITGFIGQATLAYAAPNIDGGLVQHPSGVHLFTRNPTNALGQRMPGSAIMNKSADLTVPGIFPSVGMCQIVPPGFPGAGQLKIASFSFSTWQTVTLAPDGAGTFNVQTVSAPVQIRGGPEGAAYVRGGSVLFPNNTILVSESSDGLVGAYEMDADGDPVLTSRRTFIAGMNGAQGAHIDRLTGDFLFSTLGGGNRVIVVRGFLSPCSGDANSDNHVDFLDLNIVLGNYGASFPDIAGDLNHDCAVDFLDLNIVLGAYGAACAGG